MTTRIYMCGPYSQRLVLKERAEELVRESGGAIEITSSWLDGEHEAREGVATLAEMAEWALADLNDIDRSDVLVQFTEHPSTRGSAHFEAGYALASGKQVVSCGSGDNETIFHSLESVISFGDWSELRIWLRDEAAAERSAA